MSALGWHASAHVALLKRFVAYMLAVRLADVQLGIGLQPEHRGLEHGERLDDVSRMLVASDADMRAYRPWRRFGLRALVCVLPHVRARLACFGSYRAA